MQYIQNDVFPLANDFCSPWSYINLTLYPVSYQTLLLIAHKVGFEFYSLK